MKLLEYILCAKKTSKNVLICVPKMNEGVTGLEQHEVE